MTDGSRVASSPLFDDAWYARRVSASAQPFDHYLETRGRAADPHPLFLTDWYLDQYPEAASWPTPLHHYLERAHVRPLDPHPYFDAAWYQGTVELVEEGVTPLEHFLRSTSDHSPHPLFDPDHYRSQLPGGSTVGHQALVHYLLWGAARGVSPHPMIDLPDLGARLGPTGGMDPVTAMLAKLRSGRRFDLPLPYSKAPRDTQSEETATEADWKWEYLVEEQWRWPETFAFYRIIGNDLPPRHTMGQALENVRFILDNEPRLVGCEKGWIVNRIIEESYERKLIDLLEEYDQTYLVIPFRWDEYRNVGWRLRDFEAPGLTFGRKVPGVDTELRHQVALDHLYHDKNLYVMNNNGARNTALEAGTSHATWVLPFDGNCFFTEDGWESLRRSVLARPHLRYFSVPMARIRDNDALLEPGFFPEASEEPQLIFRWDARERFNEDARYGRRPKVELFYRLGIPGNWDRWRIFPWEEPRPALGGDAGRWGVAGWVARLFSGKEGLEADIKQRGQSRFVAIQTCIDRLDQRFARRRHSRQDLFTMHEPTLQQEVEQLRKGSRGFAHLRRCLLEEADRIANRPIRTVIDKGSLAPSRDPHDYWHPAPYYWPDPTKPDGLPYVRRDGYRVPGTELGESGSDLYDRTALQELFDGVFILALAGLVADDQPYHEHASALIHAWFIDPTTRMNPHLRYAQVRRGRNNDEGSSTGIIEFGDVYYMLDGVRLLEDAGAFRETSELQRWLAEYRDWLHSSEQGLGERRSRNNHGTWYDIQDAAVSAYLDDVRGVIHVMRRAEDRLREQFADDGHQPHEAVRPISLHYHTYNLQAFLHLAHMADRVGGDLWNATVDGDRPLENGLRWLLRFGRRPWPFQQTQAFDHDRLLVLTRHAVAGYPDGLPLRLGRTQALKLRPVPSPHFGLRPFWQLGLRVDSSSP